MAERIREGQRARRVIKTVSEWLMPLHEGDEVDATELIAMVTSVRQFLREAPAGTVATWDVVTDYGEDALRIQVEIETAPPD